MGFGDETTKALTIQISAEDLTGSVWNDVDKNIKKSALSFTELNQAWELGAKVFEKAKLAIDGAIDAIASGGEYAEAKAGFDSLSESFNANGKKIVDSIREISEGNTGLLDATQAASNAIKKGFSAEQIEIITAYAKKQSDVVGGSFIDIAESIERSIATGTVKGAKQYDIFIEKGETLDSVMEKIQKQSEAMGAGSFNFGDSWGGALQSVSDASISVFSELNKLIGSEGATNFSDNFRQMMRVIEDDAFAVAVGIKESIMVIVDPVDSLFSFFDSFFDTAFSNTDTLKIKMETMISSIGNTFFDTATFVGDVWNTLMIPIDEFVKGTALNLSDLLSIQIKIGEITGLIFTKETIADFKETRNTLNEIGANKVFSLDLSGITDRQSKFNKAMEKSGEAAIETTKRHAEFASGIKFVGQNAEDAEKNVKKLKDAINTKGVGNMIIVDGVEVFQGGGIAPTSTTSGGTQIWSGFGWDKSHPGSTGFDKWSVPGEPSQTKTINSSASTISSTSKMPFKCEIPGIDRLLADFMEGITNYITNKAIAEGVITAGV